ncbi:hypothetical protein [uncultured Methanoregula sp.]|uniref:hypothetical protein n=1 Tax=uncultured Methanoregula sp. TaxID=1005933 RepID=UPI002AAC14EA|nr:hypothetical protein [uncultured Methanoregula sp.]
MVEYILISGILMCLFVVMLLLVNANFMEGPANTIAYSAFTDVGNGVSTRIVDTYAIAPAIGNISSHFDIPDDIAGQDYFVEIGNTATDDPTAQTVTVWRNTVSSTVGIAGIGSTLRAAGNTTGAGMNMISYDSEGF